MKNTKPKKEIAIMLYPEILDTLESLLNEEIGQMFRLINKWRKDEEVIPQNSLEKVFWGWILPKLEKNKETYTNIVERNTNAANKRWNNTNKSKTIPNDASAYQSIPNDASAYECIPNDTKCIPNDTKNANPNPNNISKDILGGVGIEQQESPEGDSVVSKGLESMENMFPERKRDLGINEINLWNNLSQIQKSNMVKKAALYIRKEEKNESGKYMKKLSKWFNEELDKGVDEDLLPTKPKVAKRTFSHTDGQIDGWLTEKGLTSKEVTTAYSILNHSGLEKDDLRRKVYFSTKEDLLNLIKTNLEQTKK